MATTIRLTRMGRKQAPFYRIVVSDSRERRDGGYIDSLGFYNPIPDAYELSLDHDKAVEWLDKGAQPTDTARSLLRTEGVLLRWHLKKSGTALAEIESQVEEFRARRAEEHQAIKAKSASVLEKWQQEKENAAAAKQKAAEAAAKPAEPEAATEPEPAAESADSTETTES